MDSLPAMANWANMQSAAAVTWSHATNSKAELRAALEGGKYQMIETDILQGTIDGEASAVLPIMAHPPATTSDLSFHEFLQRVVDHNMQAVAGRQLGIKLDFKDPQAVAPCLHALHCMEHPEALPAVWLNADIWAGPGGKPSKFDPEEFLAACFAACVSPVWTISVGWTVTSLSAYSAEHVTDALRTLQAASSEGKPPVTFAISAYHAYLGQQHIAELLAADSNFTLTVWGEVPNKACADWLDRTIASERAFVDTKPAGPIARELEQSKSSNSSSWWRLTGIMTIVAVAVVLTRINRTK